MDIRVNCEVGWVVFYCYLEVGELNSEYYWFCVVEMDLWFGYMFCFYLIFGFDDLFECIYFYGGIGVVGVDVFNGKVIWFVSFIDDVWFVLFVDIVDERMV